MIGNPIQSQAFPCEGSSHILGLEFDPESGLTEFYLWDTNNPDEPIELSAQLGASQLYNLAKFCFEILDQPKDDTP